MKITQMPTVTQPDSFFFLSILRKQMKQKTKNNIETRRIEEELQAISIKLYAFREEEKKKKKKETTS